MEEESGRKLDEEASDPHRPVPPRRVWSHLGNRAISTGGANCPATRFLLYHFSLFQWEK